MEVVVVVSGCDVITVVVSITRRRRRHHRHRRRRCLSFVVLTRLKDRQKDGTFKCCTTDSMHK